MTINLAMILPSMFLFAALMFCLIPLVAYIFYKTRNVGQAFSVGFAYPLGFLSPFIIYSLLPEQFELWKMDNVLFPLVAALVSYWLLKKIFHLFWVLRAVARQQVRTIRKVFKRKRLRLGLWQISW